jgi:hypothetical protein
MYGIGGSEAIARDMNSLLFSSSFKQSEGEFNKNRDLMSSDLYNSALLRNRSAPSSFFASLLEGGDNVVGENYLNPQSSSPESETIFSGFEPDSRDLPVHYPVLKHENTESVLEQNNFAVYNNTSIESSYGLMNSTGMENLNHLKKSNGDCSNLIRQSSSPAGFLSYKSTENGFAAVRDVGNNRNNTRINLEPNTTTTASRLSNQMSFSSGPSSCSRFSPRMSENGTESTVKRSPENLNLGNNDISNRCYIPNIPTDWNNSTFNGSKRNRDGEMKVFSDSNGLSAQSNGDGSQYSPSLVHHMSLPKTSAEMAAVEKYLQFQQDTVPCKIRAKRGFATHPRSIAERVRRTRISERMRKLQELFPNMDKQANTADMLDMAVEYIKDLQKEVETLKETRSKCTCSSKKA